MTEPISIFFAGGGTGGHLYPGIAVAEALRASCPQVHCVFLCTTRAIDRVILGPGGFEFVAQPIVPPVRSVGGLLRFWKSWRETGDLVKRLLRERRPKVVLGLGGYAAGVAVRKAASRGIPCAVLNPDVLPGKANKFLMNAAQLAFCQFEATAQHVDKADRPKLRITGCPIRPEFRALPSRQEAARRLGLDPLLSTLVVTGASLGARTVNEAVLTMLTGMEWHGWQVLHLSGRDHAESVRAGYRELEMDARVIDFTPDMADVWAVAEIAISRSGASSCAELTACGVPSILMPYPFHRDMHQRTNAEQLANAGAAILIDDEKDCKKNAQKLRPALESLLYDANRRKTMGIAARALGKPAAAEKVAGMLLELARA